MNRDYSFFPWQVPLEGFEWRGRGPFLKRLGHQARTIYPLDSELLFLEFADLHATPQDVLSFAAAHGSLRVPNSGPETLDDWSAEIASMKEAVELWNAARDPILVRKLIEWDGDAVVYKPRKTLILAEFERNDLFTPASYMLAKLVNEGLAKGSSLQLHAYRENASQKRFQTFRLANEPVSLPAALWLQFALALEGGGEPFRCGNSRCRKFFWKRGDGTERAKKFCSDSCKVTAHREKHLRAVELHAKGRKLAEIAAELGSTIATVKGWISK
jgi:hypothetical protein